MEHGVTPHVTQEQHVVEAEGREPGEEDNPGDLATVNERLSNSLRSSSGSEWVRWRAKKAAISTPPSASEPSVVTSNQPHTSDCESPSASPPVPP